MSFQPSLVYHGTKGRLPSIYDQLKHNTVVSGWRSWCSASSVMSVSLLMLRQNADIKCGRSQ